eukprot:1663177-Rhodomonas_salina.1
MDVRAGAGLHAPLTGRLTPFTLVAAPPLLVAAYAKISEVPTSTRAAHGERPRARRSALGLTKWEQRLEGPKIALQVEVLAPCVHWNSATVKGGGCRGVPTPASVPGTRVSAGINLILWYCGNTPGDHSKNAINVMNINIMTPNPPPVTQYNVPGTRAPLWVHTEPTGSSATFPISITTAGTSTSTTS